MSRKLPVQPQFFLPFLAGCTILLAIFVMWSQPAKSPTIFHMSPFQTQIVDYRQTSIPQDKQFGYCWTSSVAAPTNSTAWRCSSTKSEIFDPCFQTPAGQIACNVNPNISQSGFELKLTKKLPQIERKTITTPAFAWRIELENGAICSPLTGTAGFINGKPYFYTCDPTHVLTGVPAQNNNIWQAELTTLSADKTQITATKNASILTLWK